MCPCYGWCDHVTADVTLSYMISPYYSWCSAVTAGAILLQLMWPYCNWCARVTAYMVLLQLMWPCYSWCDPVVTDMPVLELMWPCYSWCGLDCGRWACRPRRWRKTNWTGTSQTTRTGRHRPYLSTPLHSVRTSHNWSTDLTTQCYCIPWELVHWNGFQLVPWELVTTAHTHVLKYCFQLYL